MTEDTQKYELLGLFPLSGTEEEVGRAAGGVVERLKAAGAAVASSAPVHRGKLAYPIKRNRQGHYQVIQFEIAPAAIGDLHRQLILSGAFLRFTITKVKRNFTPFTPTRVVPQLRGYAERAATKPVAGTIGVPVKSAPPPSVLTQEPIKAKDQPKISMEEINKKLEEILGE